MMMKKRVWKWAGVLSLAVFVLGAAQSDWDAVKDATNKGLPKTAITALEPIIAEAMEAKRYDEAIKAICTKIALEGTIQGNKPEEKVVRLEAEIEQAPAAMKPVMQAISANWYYHYFQQNRWRFRQRTQTAEAPGDDFTTWALPRILSEIDKHFTIALANETQLKAQSVSGYDQLLEKGTMPDRYRPTLFDFLAHEALQFYQAGEQGAALAEDAFVLDAGSPIFAPLDTFLAWEPETSDTESPTLKAIELFQNLLAFHQDDEKKAALLDVNLSRLTFGKNQAVGPGKDETYKEALARFEKQWRGHPVAGRALHALAQALQSEKALVKAHALATRGAKEYADFRAGPMCQNLITSIEAPSVSIQTERVWSGDLSTVDVSYKNIENAYFRAIAVDFDNHLSRKRWGGPFGVLNGIDWKEREAYIKELRNRDPVHSWTADLPETTDYQTRTEAIPAPRDLEPGFYIILASHHPSFSGDRNQVAAAALWVSELGLVIRQSYERGTIDGFVLQAISGEPVAGATVQGWVRDRNGHRSRGPKVTTDENGMFLFKGQKNTGQMLLVAGKEEQRVSSANDFSLRMRNHHRSRGRTVFFTDRALYRPGQTIQYKGVCYHYDTGANHYRTLTGRNLTVVLRDHNNKEVARQSRACNDFGAFSGSFTAPEGAATGRMRLRVENGPSGSVSFNVEEYKRPKFEVEMKRPEQAARLGGTVTVSGKAAAYTGAAIGSARVKWRVVRKVRFPDWCWWGYWWIPPAARGGQNIAHGTTETETDGTFSIAFEAMPDRSIPKKNEPIFSYTVYADVTDTTGETRSASRAVRVGYTALSASLSVKDWQTTEAPIAWTVSTQTFDGEPQATEGALTIYTVQQPEAVQRQKLSPVRYNYWWFQRHASRNGEPPEDPAKPESWALGEKIVTKPFATDATGTVKVSTPLKPGIYRAMLETRDRYGKTVTARKLVQVVDLESDDYPVRIPHRLAAPSWRVEPGETFKALWGTGYQSGRAFVEIEHDGEILKRFWTEDTQTQRLVEFVPTAAMRGGFTFRLTYVRENRGYLENRRVDVPWSNKTLSLKWEHFTSKLKPGQENTWTAVITGPDAQAAVAEMVATLYDASLDQYKPHNWMRRFNVFRRENAYLNAQFQNGQQNFQRILGSWNLSHRSVKGISYRHYPPELSRNIWRYGWRRGRSKRAEALNGGVRMEGMMAAKAMPAAAISDMAVQEVAKSEAAPVTMAAGGKVAEDAQANGRVGGGAPPEPDLSKVVARKNLNETAFFFPHLVSDEDGVVRMTFTMPEALTQWKLMGFAHDNALRSGFLTGTTVTAKDLMVQPNPPRFLREGDIIEFTVKVSNQSPARQTGKVRLTFADARTLKDVTETLGIEKTDQAFDVPSMESRTYSWRMSVPDDTGFLTYKTVGATDRLSDGEEGYLPVLSRRILVTESLPLPVRGKQTKRFTFKKLLASAKSKTLKHQALTVQMVSQPAWYAVMALPYLMEYPHECSEQVFNRLYANSLARYIAGSDPKIRRIFDQWKNTPALDSPLEKHQDLKAVMIEETPWLRAAGNESQARRNVGILFDDNRLDTERGRAYDKLAQQQLDNGLWPWFPGLRGDHYITLYIVTGFGRMRHLGAESVQMALALKALPKLDDWMNERYHAILKRPHPDQYVPTPLDALYLYGRSFFLKDQAIAKKEEPAIDFFLKQSKKFWLGVNSRQSQGHLAIALKRFGDLETPVAIMKSIKERSVSDEELGMFWRDLELSWWWFRAPIETQALMIEAFDEVMGDAEAVEDCKVWLLKQKQTQNWKTTKATADAVYGLLLRGTHLLSSDALVKVSLGGEWIKPEHVEAGTGFYEERFVRKEIEPQMGDIVAKKVDEGVSWGSVHWQYLEDMSKVTPYEGTPLKLEKALYKKVTTKKGQVLEKVKGPVSVGDELVCRIELRVDRDMEYIHLKDQRGSGTEPVNVLSRNKYQDGLMYYESTRDTASHFFIHYLPKGVYVFEYSVRVQLKGEYQSGMASIQCMYAPEFNSHSGSVMIEVE